MIYAIIIILLMLALLFYGFLKPLPSGTGLRTKKYRLPEEKVKFLYDISWFEENKRQSERFIFDEVKKMLKQSKSFFLMDMFLFNLNQADKRKFLPITRELTDLLIEKKQEHPDYKIYLITDPFNSFYGSYEPEIFAKLKKAGIPVIETDVDQLRDRNYLYSSVWRIFFAWFDRVKVEPSWIPDPTSKKKRWVSFRSILRALNARANHRKVVVADEGEDVCALITSANIHEASSWFTNTAFKVYGAPAFEALQSEEGVAWFSKAESEIVTAFEKHEGNVVVQLLTENKIKEPLLEDIEMASKGEVIYVAILFIADLMVINALVKAAKRGVSVRLVLDPNNESFGQSKMGFPNYITGWMLHDQSGGKAEVRWWKNETDQLHAKFMVITKSDHLIVYSGSANYTVRNIGGYTLESNLRLEIPKKSELAENVLNFTNRLFEDQFSVEIGEHPKKSNFLVTKLIFYIQKITGFTTY